MKNMIPRILIIFSVLIIAGLIFSFVNSFYGNPISTAIATSKIKEYVKDTYPDMNLEVPDATYNFKFEEYHSQVKSKTSIDTCFWVGWSNGRINDSYEYDVEKRGTTYQRLQSELDNTIEDIIKKEFPYETSMLFADFAEKEGNPESMELDMSLDIKNPPVLVKLTIYILTDEVSDENLCARLLELSDIMKEHEIPVSFYDVVLQEPMPEGEKAAPDGQSLYLYDFPADKLSEPDLMGLIKDHQNEWEEKYSKE